MVTVYSLWYMVVVMEYSRILVALMQSEPFVLYQKLSRMVLQNAIMTMRASFII